MRTGESELFGPLYWSVRSQAHACRWRHPELHGSAASEVPRPTVSIADSSTAPTYRTCMIAPCDGSYQFKSFVTYKTHMTSVHKVTPPLHCEFGCTNTADNTPRTFESASKRGKHYNHCPLKRELRKNMAPNEPFILANVTTMRTAPPLPAQAAATPPPAAAGQPLVLVPIPLRCPECSATFLHRHTAGLKQHWDHHHQGPMPLKCEFDCSAPDGSQLVFQMPPKEAPTTD